MEPLETFVVQTTVEAEAAPYRKIIEDVISDLMIAGAIGRLKIVVRPEDSLFQMVTILREGLPLMKVDDFADVGKGTSMGEVQIMIREERPLPRLLESLWARYGRGAVTQPERRTLLITVGDPKTEIPLIKEMVVDDPRRTLRSRLVDMAIRSTPEGFRVRYHSLDDNNFIFVASEDPMKQEWIDEADKMLDELKGDDVSGIA
ncbi:MAG: methanogenesis marker 17 protein [Methanosarcinaceae archaeon]|nr:methanogenesis marker 17 protein [Methanosarcinaceae archaeon]